MLVFHIPSCAARNGVAVVLTIGAHLCPPLPLSSINLLIMPSHCSGCPGARISSSHHPTYTQCHRHAPKLPVSSVSRMVLFRQTRTLMFHTPIVSMRPQTVHGHPQPNLPCDVRRTLPFGPQNACRPPSLYFPNSPLPSNPNDPVLFSYKCSSLHRFALT